MSAGLLAGLRVVELASDRAAFAGKLLADLGADVVLVEPAAGHPSRRYAPFAAHDGDANADDDANAEADDAEGEGEGEGEDASLHWWHYQTSKRGVALDWVDEPELLRRLLASADLVLEAENPSTLAALGLGPDVARRPDQVWVSVTPYGSQSARNDEPVVDLTMLAAAGPVWSSGYDDHSIPPVRPGVNQAHQTASIWAVMGALTALLWRTVSGQGQHVDVSTSAAVNVTTENATYEWLVSQVVVQRQTGRMASATPTRSRQLRCRDGRLVQSGVPPRTRPEYAALLGWLVDLDLVDEFPEAVFVELGAQRDTTDHALIGHDDEVTAIVVAAASALELIATRLTAYEYFVQSQQRGLASGIIYAPEEVIEDPHFRARGFPVEVMHPELGEPVVYPGAPFVCDDAPWRISRRAPRLGEHDDEILGPLRGQLGDR